MGTTTAPSNIACLQSPLRSAAEVRHANSHPRAGSSAASGDTSSTGSPYVRRSHP
ncbi:hypothetical protein OG509_04590 [Streptomyces sp. NBC_01006]|nr:hypothetical protein OG509_04590 [Streptomyces sp. NBC_01006]